MSEGHLIRDGELTYFSSEVPEYEFDVLMGNMGDTMAKNEFTRAYNKHLRDGWEPWGEHQLVISQQEQKGGGLVRIGFVVMVAQAWRRKVVKKAVVQ